jgi:N-acetylmuramoyl-L-alanine amidase
MDQSLQFATLVQQNCVEQLKRKDRGVRQAAFWVLLKTACPAILFEMGFVSHPEEEKFLSSNDKLDQLAQAITEAFESYAKHQITPQTTKPATKPTTKPATEPTAKPVSNTQKTTYYAIQILASQKALEANAPQFKGYKCQYIRAGGYYKYYTAENTDRSKVEEKLQQVKKSFPDCWIITFQK